MAMAQPKVDHRPRIKNPRSARTATQTRIVKTTRARYPASIRVTTGLCIALVGLMSYVMLLSNTTSLTYAVDKAHHQRDALQEQTARLDDRIAQASSEERLAAIAAKLQMHDAQTFAVVHIEAPPLVAKSRIPLFDTIAAWF
jgi:cytochrome c-type biogenesis protein CcmH/NrfG